MKWHSQKVFSVCFHFYFGQSLYFHFKPNSMNIISFDVTFEKLPVTIPMRFELKTYDAAFLRAVRNSLTLSFRAFFSIYVVIIIRSGCSIYDQKLSLLKDNSWYFVFQDTKWKTCSKLLSTDKSCIVFKKNYSPYL